MAPTKKSRGGYKRVSNVSEASPNKDARHSNNYRQRKRKMSDMLGSQWNKGEIQLFYESYRKFGKDWKKVASALSNRSVEMVETLYNMNRAYLSLPEGTASVVGLIAMMTDHYNVMDESDGRRRGDDAAELNQKLQKCGRGNFQRRMPRENPLQSHPIASSEGCLSLLKWGHSNGWAVGKRTPRIPVSYSYKSDDREVHSSPRNRGEKLDSNAYDDEHVAALWLAEASQKGSSPQHPRTSYTLVDHLKPSPRNRRERMHVQLKMSQCDHHVALTNEEYMKDLGSNGTVSGNYVRNLSLSVDKGVGMVETHEIGTKLDGKINNIQNMRNDECKPDVFGAAKGLELTAARGVADFEITKEKVVPPSPQSQNKRSKRRFFGDEGSALDGLLALADISLMMSTSTKEIVGLKEDKLAPDIDDKSSLREDVSFGSEVTSSGISKLGENMPIQVNALPEQKLLESTNKWKGMDKSLTLKVPTNDEVTLPTKQTNRRKNVPKKIWARIDSKPREDLLDDQLTPQGMTPYLKETLSSLSSLMFRRWCAFEWFYSSIDYPWFSKNEFEEYLNHVGLGHIPRLSKVEWGVIKSSLGKSRRFSVKFLQEERDKLKQYRESVRIHYGELRAGITNGLATDLAQPLTVGQRVIALHPTTSEVHDGKILTVDHDRYRVQFDSPEIGVEFVKDIDCISSKQMENVPLLKRQRVTANKLSTESKKLKVRVQSTSERPIAFQNEIFKSSLDYSYIPSSNDPVRSFENHMKGHTIHSDTHAKAIAADIVNLQTSNSLPVHLQSKEADSYALLKPTSSLDNKVSSVLQTKQENTYPVNTMPLWLRQLTVPSDSVNPQHAVDNAHNIVQGSRIKAQDMVEAAIKAIFSAKEGEDAFRRAREALYSMKGWQSNGSLGQEKHLNNCKSEPLVTGDQSHLNLLNINDGNEPQIPSQLITSCVATLLAIQKCTERQYPPADVARILDSFAGSLQPVCSQNIPIYQEIQMCMGRIKTQILALIPT